MDRQALQDNWLAFQDKERTVERSPSLKAKPLSLLEEEEGEDGFEGGPGSNDDHSQEEASTSSIYDNETLMGSLVVQVRERHAQMATKQRPLSVVKKSIRKRTPVQRTIICALETHLCLCNNSF